MFYFQEINLLYYMSAGLFSLLKKLNIAWFFPNKDYEYPE